MSASRKCIRIVEQYKITDLDALMARAQYLLEFTRENSPSNPSSFSVSISSNNWDTEAVIVVQVHASI